MKIYVKSIWFSLCLSIVSFSAALLLHYLNCGKETEFWCNVALSVFGSGLLTLISSILSYRDTKIKTLERFKYYTKQIVHILNKYQQELTVDTKVNFFLDYADFDKTAWDAEFGNICFFTDFKKRDKIRYIYSSIYLPIQNVNNAVANHYYQFRCHKDGSVRNEYAMKTYINEIEPLIIKETEYKPDGENGDTIICTENELEKSVLTELNGYYYDLMHSKKIKENNNNG
ncbi:MAG: hypothetical protein Q4E35_05190 [Eubacteriales bacterium]|nr:hypothetical protein [Eubacteriales bacterium]